ncbi:hypothetical protein [Vibrio sp. CyArs1]|uniref:hypothetical protein n=1 Tax=Vibrio TaxID=662 RepID=UPI001F061843|nr:hypothetical protein [Vibrio sp. CyArs1]
MRKLAVVIAASLSSGSVIAHEVDFKNYFSGVDADKESVIISQYSDDTDVSILQNGESQQSVVDIKGTLNAGNDNDVTVRQFGYSNDSLIKIKEASGGNDITVVQRGSSQDSRIEIEGDADHNLVVVRQRDAWGRDDSWSDIKIDAGDDNRVRVNQYGANNHSDTEVIGNSSDNNRVRVAQDGDRNDSDITINDGARNRIVVAQTDNRHKSDIDVDGSLNRIGVTQSDNIAGEGHDSDIDLTRNSNNNSIEVTQTGYTPNESIVSLVNSSGNNGGLIAGISVTQTGNDYSNIQLSNSNTGTYVVVQN